MLDHKRILVISGPTASGKSFLAHMLALKLDGVIINADSMQIYKGLPILSAQPSIKEQKEVEHRLYSFLEPSDNNSVYKWLVYVKEILNNTKKLPIIVGGTGMYISRLIFGIKQLSDIPEHIRKESIELYNQLGYTKFLELATSIDPQKASNIGLNDKQRLMRIYEIQRTTGYNLSYFDNLQNEYVVDPNIIFHINILPDRNILYDRCLLRFKAMLDYLDEEVKQFIDQYSFLLNTNQNYAVTNTLGFKEYIDFLKGKCSFEEMLEASVKSTRHYAKRQITWFKNQFKFFNFKISSIPDLNNIEEICTAILKSIFTN